MQLCVTPKQLIYVTVTYYKKNEESFYHVKGQLLATTPFLSNRLLQNKKRQREQKRICLIYSFEPELPDCFCVTHFCIGNCCRTTHKKI